MKEKSSLKQREELFDRPTTFIDAFKEKRDDELEAKERENRGG